MIWLVESDYSAGDMVAVNTLIGKIHHAIENTQKVIDNASGKA